MAWREVKQTRITSRNHRLIPSRFPPIDIFEDIATTPDEVRVAMELEAMTNGRLASHERMALIPNTEIVTGAGATYVMAAFLHTGDEGSRFNDARLGAWYGSLEVETAISEVAHHNTRRLRASAGGFPNSIQLRELVAHVDCELVDLRGLQKEHAALYHPSDYQQSQIFASELRWPTAGTGTQSGVVFDSVRKAGGTNVCILWPSKVILPVNQADHYRLNWDNKGNLTAIKETVINAA